MTVQIPVAVPGDICILIIPDHGEEEHILSMQRGLQAVFGGQIFSPTHVTAQRFSSCSEKVLAQIARFLKPQRPLDMQADRMTQFYSEFWGRHVLRWHVERTSEWQAFRQSIEENLNRLHCPPHYPADKPATCTALEVNHPVDLDRCTTRFPIRLYSVRRLQLSRIEGNGKFKILEEFSLKKLPDRR